MEYEISEGQAFPKIVGHDESAENKIAENDEEPEGS
jgi:hypothetical protein